MSERWKDSDKFVRPQIDPWERKRPRISGDNPFSPSTSAGTPLEFETLESRLLLAADPLGITAGYAFDEVSGTAAADASGNAIVGTLTNGPTFTAGKYGNAVLLDGTNDYVNLGNPPALQLTGSMTISAWINSSSFPVDDAAIVSKRTGNESGFQLDTTVDKGTRTIGFKLTNSAGSEMYRYGATTLQPNTWYHVAGVYDAAAQTLNVYLNGQLDNGVLQGTVTASQQNSTANVTIGRRAGVTGFEFNGRIDDVRIADHALTQDQIQTNMVTPLGPSGPDVTLPTVSLTAPAANATIAGTVTVSASASDNVGVASVQFLLDGTNLGTADSTSPYSVSWNTTTAANGTHRLQALATDISGNTATTTDRFITVDNQAPTGTIVINSGATATNSRNATLTLSASDALSSVTQMRFSNSGTGAFSTAEPFATTKAWTLSNGAGTKTVFVQFMDSVGNWSTAAISDTIVLDTTAPTISGRTASNITGSSATITWTTNEAATSRVEYGLTTSYGSSTALDPTLVTTHSVTITGLAPSTTYNWRVRSMDAAGNETVSANSTFATAAISDTTVPTVTWSGPPANSILLGTVTLTATASDNVAVGGVQFLLDGNTLLGTEDTTSPYSFSWNTTTASNGTHTLQARARDTSGNTATTAAISVTVDNLAPTGSVVINSNAAATRNTTVTLTLSASDTQGPVTQMRFSNDGTTFSTAEAYATSKSWALTSGDGTKTVYAQFRDAAGNWSTAAIDTIVLDTTAPSTSAIAATVVTSSSVTITWTTNEPSTSQVDYGPTTIYGSTTPLDSTLVTAHSVTLTGLTSNATYNFRVRSSDALANEAVSANATFIIDTAAPSVPIGLTATAISSTQINLSWAASTDNVGVSGHQVFQGATLIATTPSPSYSNTGLTPNTSYSYSIKAVDAAGNISGSSATASATTLASDTTFPTVTLTAPPASTVTGTVTVSATASDNVGVAGVQFLLDNANLGAEDTTSPYSISWDTTGVANGTHVLLAKARDGAGNITSSLPVTVTVANTQVPNLAAGYAFNETSGTTAADASGHGIVGTLTNGPTFAAGKYGNAVNLDGVNDFVNLGNPAALQLTGSMTLSAWVNASSFPADDAGVISKRGSGESGFQLDLTKDTGSRTIGFKLTTSSGGQMFRYGATTLQPNTWYHIAGVYNAATQTMNVYLNGVLDNGALVGTVATSQQNSTADVNIGRRSGVSGFEFAGRIDDVRIADRALTQLQIQTDMATPLGQPSETVAPQVQITAPSTGAQVSDIVTVTANATDNVGIAGVQFLVDGVATGPEDTTSSYAFTWDTRTVSNGAHTLTALARDLSGNTALSAAVTVNVSNANYFRNEILATGFDLPTAIKFLPDGRMLVVELAGKIKVMSAPYTTPSPTLFLQLTNIGSAGVQQGIYDIALDPNFSTNHYYYLFYTLGSPNVDRFSRFTANATLTGTIAGSEFVIYQDTEIANAEHHGGAINFSNDGKILLTTGEHFNPGEAQDLTKPRGKILRFNPDGTVPTDNPFYDGNGPNYDAVWALGLRNPFRAYYDVPTGRLIIGDVGGNTYSTAIEEVDIGARAANYGWPNIETPNGNPAYTAPAYYYPHNGRDSAITGGFVYHGTQFPSSYQGSYFFADYTQNWIKRLTFDANGNVNGVFNFEPLDGSVDGPYGDIVYLTEGPEGALYYVDLGYSDISGTFGVSKIRRISYVQSDLPPVVSASATPTQGPAPLTVSFSSAGSSDPEGHALSYAWTFGDGVTSTLANPVHTYALAGPYQARLTISDGVNSTLSPPLNISAGSRPVVTLTTTPADNGLFRAGDVITFSGSATDAEDGTLPASAYTWNIDFLHEGHVHPGTPITGVTGGTFTIPTSGHDFSGFTRYRITLTVTDSSGLQSVQSATILPDKVNLTFGTAPGGLTLYLDGIAHTAPFVYDTLKGFSHTIEARDQTVGTTSYTFAAWSDGGTQLHTITAPTAAQTYTANFTSAPSLALAAAYAFDETSGTTAADASGHGINGTLTNGPTFTPGRNGNAITLDGVNDFVNLGNPTALQLTGSMTLSAWVNASSFPVDDAAVISKRGSGESGFQLDLTKDTGPRTIGFKLTTASGGQVFRYGATTLQPNTWYHIAGAYNATTQTMDVYLNGVLDNGALVGTVTSSQQNSTANVNIGRRSGLSGFEFAGRIDNLRIYNSALTQAQITADMGTPVTNQTVASTTFAPLSDGAAQQDTAVVPSTAQTITASSDAVSTPLAFVQVNAATPQSNQSQVAVTYTNAQTAGNTNILAIGWKNTTSNIISVMDAAGNTYQLAGPTAHGRGISQAIYYAKNIKAAGAGTNTVTVTFNTATPFVDIRAAEYGGLDPVNPLDVIRSAWGTSATANSGAITTTAPGELIFAAGMTTGGFSAAGTGFTNRIITTPNLDIAQDRFVTTTGSYRGIASLTRSAAWVMQVVAFKVANQTVA